MNGAPTPDEIGFEHDDDATPRENAERAIEALAGYMDGMDWADAEDFVERYVRGAGPDIVRKIRTNSDASYPDGGGLVGGDFESARVLAEGGRVGETNLTVVPEPFRAEDESIGLFVPGSADRDIREIEAGRYRCDGCGREVVNTTPAGRPVTPGDGVDCDCENRRSGPWIHIGSGAVEGDIENLLRPFWLLPAGIGSEGFEALWDDVHDWIHEYWVVEEDHEHYYHGLAGWVISTWLRPNFEELAHLMVMGKWQGGKTRLLNTLRHVAYRGANAVDLTGPSLYRAIDAFDTTVMISEYHDLDRERRQLIDGCFKGSQKRGEVVMRATETGDGHMPEVFDIFAHMGLATQYDIKEDMISRSIQIHTSKPHRGVPKRFEKDRAADLRARLLYARYRLLDSDEWREAEQRADGWLDDRDIKHRTHEKLWAIATVADLFGRLDELEPFVEAMQQQATQAEADSEDAHFALVLREMIVDELRERATLDDSDDINWASFELSYDDIGERYEQRTGEEKRSYNSWVGHIRKRHGFANARGSGGTYIKDERLIDKLEKLFDDSGLEWEPIGPDIEGLRGRVIECVRNEFSKGELFSAASVAGALKADPDDVEDRLRKCAENGEAVATTGRDNQPFKRLE